MVRSLPLRSGFFKAPELSDADQAELLAWGRSLVPDLVRQPDVEWTMVHERKGVTLFEDRQKGGLTYSVRAVGTVRASLDDVMDIFLAQTTPDYRSLMQLQLREFFADAAVLFHKEQNESEALSIKWTAARAKKSVASLGGHVGVDFCFLEYAGVVSADVVDGPRQNLNGSASSGGSSKKAAPPWASASTSPSTRPSARRSTTRTSSSARPCPSAASCSAPPGRGRRGGHLRLQHPPAARRPLQAPLEPRAAGPLGRVRGRHRGGYQPPPHLQGAHQAPRAHVGQ